GSVVRSAARIGHELETALDADVLEDLGGDRPLLVGADELVGLGIVTGRQLEVEVVESEVTEQAEAEVEQVLDLGRRLLGGHVRVRVVLREAAYAGQSVDDTGLLVAVD